MSILLWPCIIALVCLSSLLFRRTSLPSVQAIQNSSKNTLKACARIAINLGLLLLSVQALRGSGALEAFIELTQHSLHQWHLNPELLPLIITRPFSGAASVGLFAAIAHEHGGQASITLCAATIMGCSETSLYVISTYFASVGVTKSRYAIPLGLATELVGVIVALLLFPSN